MRLLARPVPTGLPRERVDEAVITHAEALADEVRLEVRARFRAIARCDKAIYRARSSEFEIRRAEALRGEHRLILGVLLEVNHRALARSGALDREEGSL